MIDSSLIKNSGYINGEWISEGSLGTFEVVNPANQEVIATLPNMGAVETEKAIFVAQKGFDSWKKTTATERYTLLNKWHDLMIQHQEELAKIMVIEQGKPLAEAMGEVVYAAKFIQWFSEQGKRILGSVMSNYSANSILSYTKEPVGVVGVITPWNFPLAMIARKVAPALAAGCTTVIKPSELTPLSAIALIRLAEQAGIPAGVCNVILTTQAHEVGDVLCSSKTVRKISFTGSTKVGKILLSQSAQTVKRVSLELGGNAPFIVFEDADLPIALNALIAAKFRNTGQTCICANRIFLHESIHDTFVDMLKTAVEKFVIADGFTEGVNQGPLINQAALHKVENHVKSTLDSGATLVTGGKKLTKDGTFYEPTILTGVSADSIFSCEETFGPVAPIIKFSTEDEVINLANETEYGLAAYFCTQNSQRIHRVRAVLQSGMIGINEGIISNEFGPFGGVKESGLGREGSISGIEEYLEEKYSVETHF